MFKENKRKLKEYHKNYREAKKRMKPNVSIIDKEGIIRNLFHKVKDQSRLIK